MENLFLMQTLVKTYISNGAQVSQTVARLLVKNGVEEAETNIKARATKPKKEEPEPEAETRLHYGVVNR